ncbi:MAG: hypothetical protein WC254_05770 [Candidatus Woesearchaeota archaeon]|jgi:hypothetical protein
MEKNKPAKNFKAGAVRATIWSNLTKNEDGTEGSYNTVALERSYKDKNGAWQTTSSLRANDVPKALLVLNKAYEFIALNEEEEVQSSSQI